MIDSGDFQHGETSIGKQLLTYLSFKIIDKIMAYENSKSPQPTISDESLRLTKDEQQVIFYVSGFIIFALQNLRNQRAFWELNKQLT